MVRFWCTEFELGEILRVENIGNGRSGVVYLALQTLSSYIVVNVTLIFLLGLLCSHSHFKQGN